MEQKPPAVVIIARHGMRLDAADQKWHLSTPTPYDPPLTYGGWNQCRALGVRIASLLDAREKSHNDALAEEANSPNGISKRRKKKKHKVVIHTSPFLRCLQTSVAISAGMAQYEAPKEKPGSSKSRTPATMHSASPRLRAHEGAASPSLSPIPEPKHDLSRALARKALGGDHKRYRKSKIRVDAFLGEWLNPQYFDHITPPPPSPMMVAGAKAELMQNEALDFFTPTLSHKSSGSSLWGATNGRPSASRESTLDDWSHVTDALAAPGLRRERSNSASSVGSNESSGRKSPFRHHGLSPFTPTVAKEKETSTYHPPTPSYAISNSDTIPRGYVTHARASTAHVDYQWDSSRRPQDWGSGGDFGEEWSSMHKRFRRGLNNLIQWYSQHNADDRAEDALGFEQAEKPEIHHEDEDEEEDLVVVMVTHGAGSNALIGALTNQPVLLDVGMASLTMAVRKDDAPPLLPRTDSEHGLSSAGKASQSPDPSKSNGHRRRSSMEIGLSAIYEMKLVSSSEHLRAGVDPRKASTTSVPSNLKNGVDAQSKYSRNGFITHAEAGAGIESNWNLGEPNVRNSSTNASLGSMRRPSSSGPPTRRPSPGNAVKSSTLPPEQRSFTPPTFTTGLWTPPAGRGSPQITAQKAKDEPKSSSTKLDQPNGHVNSGSDLVLDFTNSPPDSRPASSGSDTQIKPNGVDGASDKPASEPKPHDSVVQESHDNVAELPPPAAKQIPPALQRGLSQKGLWGRQTTGDKLVRIDSPKRRWTVNEND